MEENVKKEEGKDLGTQDGWDRLFARLYREGAFKSDAPLVSVEAPPEIYTEAAKLPSYDLSTHQIVIGMFRIRVYCAD